MDYHAKGYTTFGRVKHSIGSSGRVVGAKKHEIYVAAFGGNLFYDLFLQGWGCMAPQPPGSATETS